MTDGTLNVANLYPEWFQEILDGTKRVEYRDRQGLDARLEAVTKGEALVLRETRSSRAVLARVRGRRRRKLRGGYRYAIAFTLVARSVVVLGPKRQGWHRIAGGRWSLSSHPRPYIGIAW
jgi:hypothetical protein